MRAIHLYCDLVSGAVLDGLQAELAASGVDIGARAELPEDWPTELPRGAGGRRGSRWRPMSEPAAPRASPRRAAEPRSGRISRTSRRAARRVSIDERMTQWPR